MIVKKRLRPRACFNNTLKPPLSAVDWRVSVTRNLPGSQKYNGSGANLGFFLKGGLSFYKINTSPAVGLGGAVIPQWGSQIR